MMKPNKLKSNEEFDANFTEDVKPFRYPAEKAECYIELFDMEVLCRKARIDGVRANAQHFYD